MGRLNYESEGSLTTTEEYKLLVKYKETVWLITDIANQLDNATDSKQEALRRRLSALQKTRARIVKSAKAGNVWWLDQLEKDDA